MSARATIGQADEATLIAMICAACPTRPAPEGPGDDAALLPPGRRVLTTDALVEGTHFLRAHPPRSLGWKALAVNLSDVAAMGAMPEAFTLAMALPPDLPLDWFRAFAEGLGAYASLQGVYLAGGDTVRTRAQLMLSVTAWGEAPYPAEADPRLLRRSGGRPGDALMVMGPIGRAGYGLEVWLAAARNKPDWADDGMPDSERLEQHLQPSPPLWAGPWALAHGATAGLDLSDGLATDLPRLAAASDLVLAIDLERLPEDDLLVGVDARTRAATGEDYSLCVLVPPERADLFRAQGFVAIGRALAKESAARAVNGVVWRLDGRDVAPVLPSFAHFS